MKKVVFLLISLMVPYCVLGHNPIDIEVQADPASNQITVVIRHPVSNPRNHFIRKVEVVADEREPIVKDFTFQKGDYKRVTVEIPDLQSVEKLVITAYSNRGGSLEKEFLMQDLKE